MGRARCVGVLLAVLVVTWLPAWRAFADLESDIQRLVTGAPLKGAVIAISVRDPETDLRLVAINDEEPMIPASNMKLLTTGTALHILGADFQFQTKLLLDGDRLIVMGDGDPAFGDPELLALLQIGEREGLTVDEFLDLWIAPLKERGIQSIREVMVDDRIFDRAFVHENWPRDQLNRSYCAEVAGLTFHLNQLYFFPRPRPGQKPDISRFAPYASWIDLSTNRATSKSGSQDGNTFSIARPGASNRFTFFGNVKTTYTTGEEVTMHDMPDFFARLLAEHLDHVGIAVESCGAVALDAPESSGEVVAPVVRTPIGTVVTRCNRDSQNLYAEALLKRAGHAVTSGTQPGSWSNGAAAMRLVANERLRDPSLADPLIVTDGSGLSRDNRVTAALLTAWMATFHRDEALGPIFIDSLALGGVSGTLKSRFEESEFSGVRVQGKSGYINQVSCLSGFVSAPDGRRRTFSVLVNNLGAGGVAEAKRLQEQVVAAIARELLAEQSVEIGG